MHHEEQSTQWEEGFGLIFLDAAAVSATAIRAGSAAIIESQRLAFEALANGTALVGPRVLLPGLAGSTAFSYAARLSVDHGVVAKFGSVNPANAAFGLPSVSALVIAQDAATGRPVAVLDGDAVTAVRTPAASALAAATLLNSAAELVDLVVVGGGVQGVAHLQWFCATLRVGRVTLVGRRLPEITRTAVDLTAVLGVEVVASVDARAALSTADVVVLATSSAVPVVEAAWLAAGVTVVSVGAFAPHALEFGGDLIERADLIVVDDPDTAARQSGPLLAAHLAPRQLVGLGAVLTGRAAGRTGPEQVVVYVSVGLGIQDAAVVDVLLCADGTPVADG